MPDKQENNMLKLESGYRRSGTRRDCLFGVLFSIVISTIYFFVAGYLIFRARAMENGAILDLQLNLVAVTESTSAFLYYLAVTLIAILTIFPYLHHASIQENQIRNLVASSVLVVIFLSVYIGFRIIFSFVDMNLHEAINNKVIAILFYSGSSLTSLGVSATVSAIVVLGLQQRRRKF